MNFIEVTVTVAGRTDKGVKCTVSGDDRPFWLPVAHPAQWLAVPEVGTAVRVRLPKWLGQRHQQLLQLRGQFAIPFHQAGLDPDKAERPIPMASDYPQDAGKGAIFKNTKKEKPAHPDYRGECEIKGRKFWVSGWIRKSEKTGETYMSLAFREAEQRADDRRQQPQPDRGGPNFDGDIVPFAPEWR